MAYVPVDKTVMVEIRYQGGFENLENTLYFENVNAITPALIQEITDYCANWWFDHIRPLQFSSITLREVFGTDLTTSTSGVGVSLLHSGEGGTLVAGQLLPFNVTASVSFRTANRGRSFRGRNYVVGLGSTQISGNALLQATADAYTLAYEHHLTTIPVGWTWVVVSRFSGGVARVNGVTTPIISCGFADNVMDSQRRRLPGRGE